MVWVFLPGGVRELFFVGSRLQADCWKFGKDDFEGFYYGMLFFLLILSVKGIEKLIFEIKTSRSRAAQEQLTELEKAAAPFGEQLIEAAKFVDVDLNTAGRQGEKRKGNGAVYHGREEWLLRWLLKKLQAPKDEVPRYVPAEWFGRLGLM